MKNTLNITKQTHNSLNISYQGTEGAFGHLATCKLFPNGQHKAHATFQSVIDSVIDGTSDFGILPYENSYTGEVGEILDLLFYSPCYIHHIEKFKVQHYLLGLPGATMSSIQYVYSHPQALSQCEKFLSQYDYTLVPYTNTALSAKYISLTENKSYGAIASLEAAKKYGLNVLKENIMSSEYNATKFIVISKEKPKQGNRFSIVFTIDKDKEAGSLVKVMQIISDAEFNMESFKSRSIKGEPWTYYFHAELVGCPDSEKGKNLINIMKEACNTFKIIGYYTATEDD